MYLIQERHKHPAHTETYTVVLQDSENISSWYLSHRILLSSNKKVSKPTIFRFWFYNRSGAREVSEISSWKERRRVEDTHRRWEPEGPNFDIARLETKTGVHYKWDTKTEDKTFTLSV